jgi:CMP-N-acetylneuraminic acid synthetase
MKTSKVLSGKVGFVNIPKKRAVDIDDQIDYKIAIMLAKENEK